MPPELQTPRTTFAAGMRLRVWCKACQHQADADLEVLIAHGSGDVPPRQLRFRCGRCRGRTVDFVVMGRHKPADG